MAPAMKLTYFDAMGRAELTRLILAAGGIPYEDNRISREEWAELKPKTPLGQLPTLQVEGETLSQSITIARFAAKKAGLAGRNELEQAQADMVVDHIVDSANKMGPIYFCQDPEQKKKMAQDFLQNTLPKFFQSSEALLKARGGKYFVGDQLTWADIYMVQVLEMVLSPDNLFKGIPGEECKDSFPTQNPKLQELRMKIRDNARIMKWIKERPVTSF